MRQIIFTLALLATLLVGCGGYSETAVESAELAGGVSSADSVAADDSGFVAVEGETEVESSASFDEAELAEADTSIEESIIIEPEPTAAVPVQSGVLTAGDVDDNLNYDFFLGYLKRMQRDWGQGQLPTADMTDRITLEIVGGNGAGLANAKLLFDNDRNPQAVYANSQGVVYLFPGMDTFARQETLAFTVTDPVTEANANISLDLTQADESGVYRVTLDNATGQRPTAMDVALVIDVTGSMGDELSFLTVEFESIVANLSAEYANVDLRFALVTYRDEGDDFVTQTYDFTPDIQTMRANLQQQRADGGGDYPEAMDEALIEAAELTWRDGDVARVLILNADAPPHSRNLGRTLSAASTLRERGVRIYSLAASGVADTAEFTMRVMAAATGGRHLFLTDDSGVGAAHQEPKTPCYIVTRLDNLLFRVLSSELAGTRIEPQASDVVREVGQYDRGVCLVQAQ